MQMNQDEIARNIDELTEKILSGDKENISKFLESKNGIYIPTSLRKKIKKILDSAPESGLNPDHIKRMKELINEYLTKQNFLF